MVASAGDRELGDSVWPEDSPWDSGVDTGACRHSLGGLGFTTRRCCETSSSAERDEAKEEDRFSWQ